VDPYPEPILLHPFSDLIPAHVVRRLESLRIEAIVPVAVDHVVVGGNYNVFRLRGGESKASFPGAGQSPNQKQMCHSSHLRDINKPVNPLAVGFILMRRNACFITFKITFNSLNHLLSAIGAVFARVWFQWEPINSYHPMRIVMILARYDMSIRNHAIFVAVHCP
jgi:hypothetical protein